MAVTLVAQNDDGDAVGANAYVDVTYLDAYHLNRGNDVTAYTDDEKKAAIIRATDFLDTRFTFRGVKLTATAAQTTEWPRKATATTTSMYYDFSYVPVSFSSDGTTTLLSGPNGEEISGIPEALKRACAEYALRALTISLLQDAPAPTGGVAIEELSQKVDVIEQRVKYATAQQSGAVVLPAYPAADLLLVRAGLVESGRQIVR